MTLEIKKLKVAVNSKEILHGINLVVKIGETHVIMGPNGSGKSTLANSLLGHPKYKITAGKILLDNIDLTDKSTDKRAKAGLFLSAQSAPEINGVTVANLLRVATQSISAKKNNPLAYYEKLKKTLNELRIDPSFAARYVNTGFSGGEKKRSEILQLLMLNPTYAILDETDAGLDVDALKIVGNGLARFTKQDKGLIIITHESRLLKYLKPDFVHIIIRGEIVKSGGKKLITEIEKNGYKKYAKTN